MWKRRGKVLNAQFEKIRTALTSVPVRWELFYKLAGFEVPLDGPKGME